MSTQQQTVLRVQTNKPSNIEISGATSLSVNEVSLSGITYSGTGTSDDPYIGGFGLYQSYIEFKVQGTGILYYNISLYDISFSGVSLYVSVKHPGDQFFKQVFNSYSSSNISYFKVNDGDLIAFSQAGIPTTGGTFTIYYDPDPVQNVFTVPEYDFLDLYSDVPIFINKSFAELQDIAKRNSDYSIGLKLPGSKKNNAFFENFYNVDNQSLYFDATSKVQCQVLLNDQSYFIGYMKLNSVSVQNSKVEYDITLYSTIGDLYGKIGNNLLKDLDFRDLDYHFNHVFNRDNVLADWRYETLKADREVPSNYFYPVMHNGYNYELSGNTTQVLTTGTTGTSLYTTTKLGSWANNSAAYSAGVQRYRINSPEDGLRNNQLKPALNLYSLIQLMFKTYGYKIKSDFMSSPWMKLLYMYGYFSDDNAKLTYKLDFSQSFGIEQCEVVVRVNNQIVFIYVVRKGTGTPALCTDEIVVGLEFFNYSTFGYDVFPVVIPPLATGNTFTYVLGEYFFTAIDEATTNIGVSSFPLAYPPGAANTVTQIQDGTFLDFSLVIDQNIKQIDVLSSIAKKFNLVFVPDPDVPNQIIVEPYQYYVGTGNIYDWTNKLSFDKGFTVQPAQNFIESELYLSDLEDGDQGNKEFKDSNSRVYGENRVYNPTEFKSQVKEIKTTFSPEVIRKWNPNNNPNIESNAVGIPLGINYTESSQEVNTTVDWIYKGVKTKPKLIFNMGNFSPFLDNPSEIIGLSGTTTGYFRITNSSGANSAGSLNSPVISHTMPLGNPDSNKINNDTISILFNSEEPTTIAGDTVTLFNAFTAQDAYNLFYENRVINAFDKNTRFLNGFFDLKLNDIQNLRANDLIKINEQFFTWNKIDNYNLTNQELTKVELVQFNNNPSVYPDRFFKYYYCEDPSTIYKFQTHFTGKNSIFKSKFYFSVLYDYLVGALGGTVTGYTSSIAFTGTSYIPYYIYEVSQSQFDNGGIDYTYDPQKNYFIDSIEESPSSNLYNADNSVWLINNARTQARLNAFTGCTAFSTAASALGVNVATINPPASITLTTGITLNVTDTGWIKYELSGGVAQYRFINTLGTYVIPDCADCDSVIAGIPYADVAAFTITSCGNAC